MRSFIPLIVALVILLLAGGGYAFGYYTLTHTAAKEKTLELSVATKTALLESSTHAENALATLASDEATLSQYSIDKNSVVAFLETLQASGRPFGTTVSVLSVADEKDGTHPRIALSLSITGPFDGVMRTLGTIEYSPYDGVLKNLTLDSMPGTKGASVWTASATYSVGVATSSSAKP